MFCNKDVPHVAVREVKVAYFRTSIGSEQDVAGFDVAVHQVPVAAVVDAVDYTFIQNVSMSPL